MTRPPAIGERMMSCFRMPGLTAREKIVLAIISFHDGPGGAWPSYQRIADEARCSRSVVGEAIRKLRLKGRLRIVKGRTTNRYVVAYHEPFDKSDCPEHLTVKRNSHCPPVPDSHCPPVPDTNRKRTEALPVKDSQSKILAWCCECGFERPAAQSRCPACGSESRAFMVLPEEIRGDVLTLPFGMAVGGIDTMQGRALFLSDEGQAGLRRAYEKIFAEHDAARKCPH